MREESRFSRVNRDAGRIFHTFFSEHLRPKRKMNGVYDERIRKKLHPTGYDTPDSISEMRQNKSITGRRLPQVEHPSGYVLNTKSSKTSQNPSLKSRYCLEELKKHEGNHSTNPDRARSRSKNPRTEPEVKRNENNCDVSFLRKLLAMNKKEELVLNRKLAKLVLEEEFGLRNEESRVSPNLFSKTSLSSFQSKREKHVTALNEGKVPKFNRRLESIMAQNSNMIPKPPFSTQYDLNGRRIYYDSENYEESEDEDRTSTAKHSSGSEDDPSVQFPGGRSKTYINTTTVIQTKSDITCDSVGLGRAKISSKRNSMTLMDRPVLEKKKEQRVSRKREELVEEESKYKKCLFTKVDASPSGKGCGGVRRENSHGDGVQNVVVHCCEVAPDRISSESKKKVLKVWNFNDIPKVKPVKVETPRGILHGIQQKVFPAVSRKDEGSTGKSSAIDATLVKRKSKRF